MPGDETFHTTIDSPIGALLLAGDGRALQGLYMQDGPRPFTTPPTWRRDAAPFSDVRTQLGEYFAGDRRSFELALQPRGSAFELAVWEQLRVIPFGETRSYGAIARALGKGAAAARAVGLANGRNPISVIIPCHRVIGADGSLTGFGGGLHRKRFLLDLEAGTPALIT